MFVNIQRANDVLLSEGIDVLITSVPQSVTYFSGYDSEQIYNYDNVFAFVVWPVKGEPTLIVPAGELRHISHRPPHVGSTRAYGTFYIQPPAGAATTLAPEERKLTELLSENPLGRSASDVIAETLEACAMGRSPRVAVEHKGDPNLITGALQAIAPGAEVLLGQALVERIRLVKTRNEIDRIRRATWIAEEAFLRIVEELRPGLSDQHLYRTYLRVLAEHEARPGFWTGGVGGRGMSAPAAMGYPVARGDFVRFDAGCIVDRYWSDVGRTIVMGPPTDQQRRYYDAITAGYQAGMAKIRPGALASEVFDASVNTVRDNGIPHYCRHHCGHGIGLYLYENPMIRPEATGSDIYQSRGDSVALEPGMVLNFEVPYYELGIGGGMMIEETVLITERGYELLSRLDRHLWVVG